MMIPGGLLVKLARVCIMLMVAAPLPSMHQPTHLYRPSPHQQCLGERYFGCVQHKVGISAGSLWY